MNFSDIQQEGMYAMDADALKRGIAYIYGSAVHGDVIEFGCYLGRTAAALAHGMSEADFNYAGSQKAHGIAERRLWVFDSFEGFPIATTIPDMASPHIAASVWAPGTPRGATPQFIIERCARYLDKSRISVGAGWFKDTLKTIQSEARFAFVHIDCDYYESTIQVLEYLFDHKHVSEGCAIYFDDWYCNRGSPEYGEQRAWDEVQETRKVRFADWGPYGVVGRSFIVHGYKGMTT
jgi:Macrocin-O-methyltransferase (TylF)